MRQKFISSTACYLIKDEQVLFLKYNKKWGVFILHQVEK